MNYRLHIPNTLDQAIESQRKTNGTYIAAGTVILVNHRHAEDLISLEKIPGLSAISDEGDAIRIGALATFDDIEKSQCIRKSLPALWQTAYETAGPQIRHRATIGGNIGCFSPASDAVTALVALDAEVEVFDGSVHQIPIEKLTELKDGAIITSVLVPKRFNFSAFEKVGKRNAMSVSVLNMAVAKSGSEFRVAVGCASSKVILCKTTSDILSKDPGAIEKAKSALVSEMHPIEDRWGTVKYRLEVGKNLLSKLVQEAQR
ncbi:MAG: FAD binding domain-containing protein [Spirochaetales bacterium]|nr:FAD binding domain-containing protein [Spirochaetales bacterium]